VTLRRLDARALGAEGVARALDRAPERVAPEIHQSVGEILAAVRERGDAALIELTAIIAFANFTTRPNVALGIESDGFAAACGLKPLAQPTAVASST